MAIQSAPYVVSTIPANYASGVPLGAAIKIAFNIDLDFDHIANTVIVTDRFGAPVKGTQRYEYRTLVFVPEAPLTANTGYQVTVLGDGVLDGKTVQGVRSILGVSMRGHYQFGFTTGSLEMSAPTLTTPTNQSVVREAALTLAWLPVMGAAWYEVQVATTNAMAPLYWPVGETVRVFGTTVTPGVHFSEGIYWWRVRAVSDAGQPGAWSDIATFAKETLQARTVTVDDVLPVDPAEQYLADPVDLIATFPEDSFSNVAPNLAIIYFSFAGPLVSAPAVVVTERSVTDEYGETEVELTPVQVEQVLDGDVTHVVLHLSSVTLGRGITQKYGPAAPADLPGNIRTNKRYRVAVKVAEEVFTSTFTSRYDPLYSSVRDVRSSTGDLLKSTPADEINYAMYLNGVEVQERMAAANLDETDISPFARAQYVRFKTAVDLVNGVYLSLIGDGNVRKKLGDLEVSREVFAPKAEEFLNKLRREMANWETQLFSGKAKPASATRAGGSTYPLNPRVGF